jgi:hypothetical protein
VSTPPLALGFQLGWAGGASTQIEFFSPKPGTADTCKLKYTPALRTMLRPPVMDMQLGANELQGLDQQLEQIARTASGRDGAPSQPVAPNAATESPLELLKNVGTDLHTLMLPPFVVADLRSSPTYVELGVDDRLLAYPWELMFDGEFLALTHDVGRYVNLTENVPLTNGTPFPRAFAELRVLLVGVAKPIKRPTGEEYDRLDAVEAEMKAVTALFAGSSSLRVLNGPQATFQAVRAELMSGYHIFHFCGHATFDPANARSSSLVLHDRDFQTAYINGILGKRTPILCFVNACETVKVPSVGNPLNVFGLARAFLGTGTYLLGTRWKVSDVGAAAFAQEFYHGLLAGRPLGESVRRARIATQAAVNQTDLAWASYVLYGDPRLCLARG